MSLEKFKTKISQGGSPCQLLKVKHVKLPVVQVALEVCRHLNRSMRVQGYLLVQSGWMNKLCCSFMVTGWCIVLLSNLVCPAVAPSSATTTYLFMYFP